MNECRTIRGRREDKKMNYFLVNVETKETVIISIVAASIVEFTVCQVAMKITQIVEW
jgi:hypothetical protein